MGFSLTIFAILAIIKPERFPLEVENERLVQQSIKAYRPCVYDVRSSGDALLSQLFVAAVSWPFGYADLWVYDC